MIDIHDIIVFISGIYTPSFKDISRDLKHLFYNFLYSYK